MKILKVCKLLRLLTYYTYYFFGQVVFSNEQSKLIYFLIESKQIKKQNSINYDYNRLLNYLFYFGTCGK